MDELHESLILKYVSGTASAAEQQQLQNWVSMRPENKELLREYEATWSLKMTRRNIDFDTASELRKFENSLNLEVPRATNQATWWSSYKIAASLTLIALCSFILYWVATRPDIIVRESGAEPITFSLPDGSTISLNRRSTVSYSEDFSHRRIELEGEAFFDVVRDPARPFVIEADKSSVAVLGTSFGFRAYRDAQRDEVFVVTGKVSLADREDNEIVLTAGQRGIHDKTLRALKTESTKDLNALSWQSKKLVFQKTRLLDVARALENYFEISIDIKNRELENCRFTSSFDEPTLDEVMEALTIALNLKVSHQNQNYTLDGERCNP